MGVTLKSMTPYLELLLVSCAISLLVTPLIQLFAKRIGALDYPEARKIHKTPTPRLGGVAVAIAFFVSLYFFCPEIKFERGIMLGALVVLGVGILDDVHRISGATKLFVLFVVTIILADSGVILNLFPYFWLNLIFTMLWIVGVISAINALDHIDGLVPGIAAIAAFAYFLVAIGIKSWIWGAMAIALVGSTLGFLRYNFSPATIFLGDSGSFFLGFMLAALGVRGAWSTNPFKAALIPIIILGVPIFDLVFVIVSRQMNGLTKSLKDIITFSGTDHFGHRLLGLGFGKRTAVLFGYLVAVCLSVGAVILRNLSKEQALLLFIQFLMVLAVVVILMEKNRKHLHKKE